MVIRMEDPTDELLNRKREIDTAEYKPSPEFDEQELAEREEAAKAYAGENEQHFVDYCYDCINQSVRSRSDIRKVQEDCYNVYMENEPLSYADKARWQARTVIPKPFSTVHFGAAAVKKAFSPNYLSVANAKNETAAEFWTKIMETQLNERHGNFVLEFGDATTMALAVGESLEMIPRWIPGKGLQFTLVEPWKIDRDPDAPRRDPQGGGYWIHKEWFDFYVLRNGEKDGRYRNVDRVKDAGTEDSNDPMMTKEAIAKRKEMHFERGSYRKLVLTAEFWGTVLDHRGELLIPSGTYTVAAGRVIQLPTTVPYKRHRWPGIGFSPLPNLLRYGGRGLLEGVVTIWEALNNIVCMHQDYLNWIVNPPTELNVDSFVDPSDVLMYPGKKFLTHDTTNGQAAVRPVHFRGRTNEVLPNAQYYDQQFQRGAMTNDAVQGLPGYRKDMTFRESAMLLDQAMGVFGLMGANLEAGAIQTLDLAADVIEVFAAYHDYVHMFGAEEVEKLGIRADVEAPAGVSGVPELDGNFHVSGMQALMRDAEALKNLIQTIVPLSERPRFAPYIKPYKALKGIVTRTNLTDEGIIVSEDEAAAIEEAERLAQEEMIAKAKAAEEDQDAASALELAARMDDILPGNEGGM